MPEIWPHTFQSGDGSGPAQGLPPGGAWAGARPEPTEGAGAYRAGVIDLGTNNCRLLIAEVPLRRAKVASGNFCIIDAFSRLVRLGEGLSQTGVLSAQAMDRTCQALQICAQKIRQSGAHDVCAVATQACREAKNGQAFLDQVRAETGLTLTMIDPDEEVRLGLAAAQPFLRRRWSHALIFDVGGGSIEVSLLGPHQGQDFALLGSISAPVGLVSLAERFGERGQDLSPLAYEQMRTTVADQFWGFAQQHGVEALQHRRQIQTLGMSGTVTTVRALDLGLEFYSRRKVDRSLFNMGRAPAIRERLLAMGLDALAAHGCIGKDRADLVLPGMAVLEGLGQVFGFRHVLVLDRGLRDGLLHRMFARRAPAREGA